jgi:membrane-bound lytic murein transglycosylase B
VRAWHIAIPLLAVVAAAIGPSPAGAASAQSTTPPDPSRPPFAEWLADVRAEALTRGIHQDIVDQAFNEIVEPLPVVIERDRAQAESVLSLEQYLRRRLTPKLVTRGREMFEAHHTRLDEVASRYGVPPRIIVGVWGLESNFGRFSGVRPTIAALATLAWDPRRSTFFRRELFNALEILNRGDIELSRMRGSWAGAMGQPQFMPSSYLKFAEDFDGDGRRDIWSSPPDVFASIANFLKGHGWTAGESWGREVKVSDDAARRIAAEVDKRQGTCVATRDMTVALPMKRWQQLGVRLPTGASLPASHEDAGGAAGASDTAALVSGATRHFLVNRNYDALLEYNCAHSYAISVGLLADRIGSAPARRAATPKGRAPRRAGHH